MGLWEPTLPAFRGRWGVHSLLSPTPMDTGPWPSSSFLPSFTLVSSHPLSAPWSLLWINISKLHFFFPLKIPCCTLNTYKNLPFTSNAASESIWITTLAPRGGTNLCVLPFSDDSVRAPPCFPRLLRFLEHGIQKKARCFCLSLAIAGEQPCCRLKCLHSYPFHH